MIQETRLTSEVDEETRQAGEAVRESVQSWSRALLPRREIKIQRATQGYRCTECTYVRIGGCSQVQAEYVHTVPVRPAPYNSGIRKNGEDCVMDNVRTNNVKSNSVLESAWQNSTST